jgi:hypothetical protein
LTTPDQRHAGLLPAADPLELGIHNITDGDTKAVP